MKKTLLTSLTLTFLFAACHKDDVTPSSSVDNTPGDRLYVLNQGAIGTNRATLDYLKVDSNSYVSNYYSAANTEKLGDVGQDLLIYGSKMYISVNNSNKVDVVNVHTGKLLASIALKQSRTLASLNGKVYATSYGDADYTSNPSANGLVAQIDTTSLSVTATVTVGRQPEGISSVNNTLYVANSGGYDASNYEKTVSVINPNSMTVTRNINVGLNLNTIKADDAGNLYIGSYGNYNDVASKVYILNTSSQVVTDSLDISASEFTIVRDTAYFLNSSYDASWNKVTSYVKYDCGTKKIISSNFLSNNSSSVTTAYGIFVDAYSGNIYIADAKNYATSGTVYQFDKNGNLLKSYTAGNIPYKMVMLRD